MERTSATAVTVIRHQTRAYFHGEVTLDNASGPVWQEIEVESTEGANQYQDSGHIFLAQTPEVFVHDADGNLTQDGRWTYVWDAENRLVEMVANSNVPDGAKARLVFAYDWRGRRIQKEVYAWNPSTLNYELSTRTKFAYDGWNLLAILDSQSSILQSFVRGLSHNIVWTGHEGQRSVRRCRASCEWNFLEPFTIRLRIKHRATAGQAS